MMIVRPAYCRTRRASVPGATVRTALAGTVTWGGLELSLRNGGITGPILFLDREFFFDNFYPIETIIREH